MSKKIIYTPKAPNPAGPYSQAVESGSFIFLSGQLPANPEADIKIQTKLVLDNIKIILEEVGLGLSNVIKTTIYLTDLSKFSIVNEVYKEYFTKEPPARSTVGVSSLPKGVGIEIEVIAEKPFTPPSPHGGEGVRNTGEGEHILEEGHEKDKF